MSTGYLIIARTKWLSDTVRGTHGRERERGSWEISDRGQQGNSIATTRLTKEVLFCLHLSLSLSLAIHKSEPFLHALHRCNLTQKGKKEKKIETLSESIYFLK